MSNHADIVAALQARWPEHRIARSLSRIEALCDLLGEPQRSCPVIQVAGTNGKGSTAIMIDSLLRSLGLRVGRYTSPHLQDLTERIVIDGEPIPADRFDELVAEVMPFVEIVDDRAIDGVSMTFYEVMTALAWVAFSQAPVDVAVVEVGMGGGWDATSVADAEVAVVCPIDYDHTAVLGNTLTEIAGEKAGIIKPGATAVLAGQDPEAAAVLLARCAEVGAKALREGIEFGLIERTVAVGGQVLRIETADGPLGDLVLPLFGAHMARNAALAVAACEAFLGGRALPADVVAEGLDTVRAPARLEVVRRSPTVLLDTCHNPHGTRATIEALRESFGFTTLVGVLAMMADKDVTGVLEALADDVGQLVVTGIAGTSRALTAEALGDRAAEVFGTGRVSVAPGMAAAIETAVALADEAGPGSGILVCGSVYAAGEARGLLVRPGDDRAPDDRPGDYGEVE
ncbi:MAG TPA: folylpolyglutamate synthase/dihydrofolate synthase family protein [Propionicimonas sp.]|jgi:dihydrofolate synthase/folylpolyglutamate synthase|nr:folylpolyglutamate synthase/dihydrofolate synthase family protein [Propionicimonas sp.]